jgi:hypothetical protein
MLLTGCVEEPEPCTVSQGADGSATITCPDGSTATVPAPPKTACTITEMDGKKMLKCGEDTAVLAENGTCDTLVGIYTVANSLDARRFGEYGCTKIEGSMIIRNTDSCEGLESLESIDGTLTIETTKLNSLDCLENLESVTTLLSINRNDKLSQCDVDALHDRTKPSSYNTTANKVCD